MEIRRLRHQDADEVAQLIAHTLRISNSRDYPEEYIQVNIDTHSAEVILERAEHGHFYVACDGERIIGCGCIAPYWGSVTESILLTIFVLPEYQNRGIGYIAIQKAFELLPDVKTWKLETILQEPANCHLYEKCGFVRVGEEKIVNDKMTLIDYILEK